MCDAICFVVGVLFILLVFGFCGFILENLFFDLRQCFFDLLDLPRAIRVKRWANDESMQEEVKRRLESCWPEIVDRVRKMMGEIMLNDPRKIELDQKNPDSLCWVLEVNWYRHDCVHLTRYDNRPYVKLWFFRPCENHDVYIDLTKKDPFDFLTQCKMESLLNEWKYLNRR